MSKINKLDIIIPARNEAENLPLLISRIHQVLTGAKISYRIIVVDDRSTDETAKKVQKLGRQYPVILHRKVGKPGKAFSILEGVKLAKTAYVCMIDADLQYPPEAIPEMLKLAPQYGVVVANRSVYKSGWFRKFSSRLNVFLFGRILFGFKCDIQSGLKIFRKEIIHSLEQNYLSPWTLDIPLLHACQGLGFKIGSVNITFHKRRNGESKISFLKTALQIGLRALHLRFFHKGIFPLKPDQENSMLGAGLARHGQRYITHSQLHYHQSALTTFERHQKFILLTLLIIFIWGLIVKTQLTAMTAIAVLSLIYFLDVCFNLYLILKGLHFPPEIKISKEELKKLDPQKLPVYSILCPLYKESSVLPQFISAISELDWPKEKLDVLLLLEEDDEATLKVAQSLKLPAYFRIIIVPHSFPKTKPKACNYGLAKALGEYIAIYDAEDKPDPLQLKKAYLGFSQVPANVICLQAKLNYYNPHHNLLTKLFTAEYSLWFDVILPGLQSIETSIPLGGTSNHFRTQKLRELQGWDPFNVTEDCDLGVRLFKEGYKTAMIDSLTLEEANSNLKNWVRQRSRWIKGYLQTYLVHMRHPLKFFKTHGWHAFVFQLIIGLKISFILINPLLWLATVAYFSLYAIVGPTIEALYPPPVFYMAAFSLIFGNFMYLYNYMIGCAKREHWSVIKYVFLVPGYWLLMGVGALVALVQLIFKPHHWEKTHHGFHLKKDLQRGQTQALRQLSSSGVAGGGALIIASILANFFNFLFNAYLGRVITLEEFGLISLFGNILLITQAFFGALSQTITHRSAYLLGRYDLAAKAFWRFVRQKGVKIAFMTTVIWLIISPFLAAFFHTQNLFAFVIFAPVIAIGLVGAIDTGFLSGNLKFWSLALLAVLAPVVKFLTAYGLVSLNYPAWIYAAIPGSMLIAFVPGWLLAKSIKEKADLPPQERHFPKKFFGTALLAGLTTTAFLSLDVILAKHFLVPKQAGYYALLALAGKMIFFAGGLFSLFVNPLVSKALGAGKNTKHIFYQLLALNVIISGLGFLAIGIFGPVTLPFLFGERVGPILSLLPLYCLGIASFTIGTSIVAYHQARKEYLLSAVSSLFALAQIIGIGLFHNDLTTITEVIAACGLGFLATMSLLHLFYEPLMVFISNLLDFFGLFGRLVQPLPKTSRQLRILIFNWRDTQHVWAGGAEVYIHELAKRWVGKGHKVTLFCGNDGKNSRNEVLDGVQIVRRGGFYTVYIWALLYYLLKFRGKFDVVVDCENGIPFFTPLYIRLPIFLLIHHVHQEIFRENLKPPLSWLAMILEREFMPAVYRHQQVITVSESSKKAIMRLGLTSKTPIVIHNGVDLSTYVPGKKATQPLLVYVGRLQPYKNLPVLIKAIKNLAGRLVSFKVVIAGFGKERNRLEELVKKYNLGEIVSFAGKISEEQKIRLYQKAWVTVNPSSMEGWGITSIEANACGTPVVAANVPGLRDSVNNPHSGFLADYQSPKEFADRIFLIITNRRLREELGINARRWATKFTWEKSAQDFLKEFKNDY